MEKVDAIALTRGDMSSAVPTPFAQELSGFGTGMGSGGAWMLHLIQIASGDQVAEELFFSDVSTGPSGDLLTATSLAAQMVGVCGMTDSLVSFQAVQGAALSDTNMVGRVLADGQGREAVETLLQEQRDLVRDPLGKNQHLVAALRDALLERAALVGPEILEVLANAAATRSTTPKPQLV